MKYVPFIFLLAFQSLAQFLPSLLVNTNGTLAYPVNFFVANSNAIAAVAGGGGGGGGTGIVTDADYGDITVGANGLIWTINPSEVSYANIQTVSSGSKLLGRGSSGGGEVQEITIGNGLTTSATSFAVTTPLTSGDKGDATFTATGGAFTLSLDDRAVTFPKMPAAVAGSIFGRASESGNGDATTILQGLGIEITGGQIRLNTNTLPLASGFAEVESMAELVTAVSSTNGHASVYFVKSYYPGRPGQGDGWWYWDPNSEYPVSGGVVASGISGRLLPIFPNNKIDVTMFGAITKGNSTINNNAFQAALAWQQDRTKGGVLYVPIGDFPITSTIRKKTKGTGTGYLVNTGNTYQIGATNLILDTGSGTFVAGDAVSFVPSTTNSGRPLEDSTEEYRVIAYNSVSNLLQIAHPGLRATVANNEVVTIHEVPRLAIVGDNHGVTQVSSERSVSTSNIMMVTDNTPIIELGGYHNLVQNLTLVYKGFQTSAQSNAACIFNPAGQRLYQAVISGVSMMRGAYGIHVEASSDETAPNNWLYNILVENAAISSIYWNKSGTENWGGGWYLQNFGTPSGIDNPSQAFTNVIKSNTNTQVTLQMATLPGNIQVGSWIFPSGTNIGILNGQAYVAKYATNGEIKFDVPIDQLTSTVPGVNGTVLNGFSRQPTKPLFYNVADFDVTALDTEATMGPDDAATPILVHNVLGKLSIHGHHCEFAISRKNGQSFIKNEGGSVTIANLGMNNCGRLGEIDVYVFENRHAAGNTNFPGHMSVGMVNSRDMSETAGIGNWILATNQSGAPPVIIGQYHKMETYRNNASHITQVGQAKTWSTTNLTIP